MTGPTIHSSKVRGMLRLDARMAKLLQRIEKIEKPYNDRIAALKEKRDARSGKYRVKLLHVDALRTLKLGSLRGGQMAQYTKLYNHNNKEA